MKKANIIVLAGQSNAVGVGHTPYLSDYFGDEKISEYENGYPNIPINYYSHAKISGGFVKTEFGCTEENADTLGPEIGIAECLTEKYPDEVFYIVKWAFGCSTMYNDWVSPSTDGYCESASAAEKPDIIAAISKNDIPRAGWCYNGLVSLMKSSISYFINNGLKPNIAAFCWMQGESDACEEKNLPDYENKFLNMFADFKKEFKEYAENCLLIDAGISKTWAYYEQLNRIKKDCAEKNGHIFIDTVANGLTTDREPYENPDIYHYDVGSVIKLGNLFGTAVLQNCSF